MATAGSRGAWGQIAMQGPGAAQGVCLTGGTQQHGPWGVTRVLVEEVGCWSPAHLDSLPLAPSPGKHATPGVAPWSLCPGEC